MDTQDPTLSIRMRRAKFSDLHTVMAWVNSAQACRQWAGPRVRFPLQIDALAQDIGFADHRAYCVVDASRLMAFGQMLAQGDGRFHWARIIVDPAHRGAGYGTLLCQHLLKQADRKRYRQLSLNVYRSNLSALQLYHTLGFREVVEVSTSDNCYMVKP